jgi:integrase
MHDQPYGGQSLFRQSGNRKYLNAAERQRFIEATRLAPPDVCLFCLTLARTGARISEALALTSLAIDIETGAVTIETLKRRKRGISRQVPLPADLLNGLNRFFQLRVRRHDRDLASARLWT